VELQVQQVVAARVLGLHRRSIELHHGAHFLQLRRA
jgi:hypothetical protein